MGSDPGFRNEIRFVLADRVHSIRSIDPTRTVLEYLREDLGRLGTKEGCAEGDCGACTVVVGELTDGDLRYRPVNSCIQFVPTLDGKQLITVEDLKGPDGTLHPVQQAMVDTDASQCGFCTPGFVMTLFGLYRHGPEQDRLTINDALAGNLCRCTGYGPIVAAALAACASKPDDRFHAAEAATMELLGSIRPTEGLALELAGRRYFAPSSLAELDRVLARHPEAHLFAGATDLGLWVTKQGRVLDTLVYLGNVAELSELTVADEVLEIGAAVTYTDAYPAITEHYPDFGELLRRLGAWQVRNAGTIGGNVANGSPIGDSPPPLIAAGATVVLYAQGNRRELPLEDFFLAYGKQDRKPGEVVEKVRLPLPRAGERLYCYKISKRFDQDISAVCAAFSLRLDPAGRVAHFRAAFGGMAGVPKRALHLERSLVRQPWSEPTVERALAALEDDFAPIGDHRASAGYRLKVAANLVYKCFVESSDPAQKTRLFGTSEFAYGQR